MELILIASLVVFLAGATQGLIGLGFGLFVMALLPWLVGFQQAVVLTAVWRACVSGSLLLLLRRQIRPRLVAPLIGGALVGVPIGVAIVAHAEGPWPPRILGALLLGWALSALRPKREELPARPAQAWGLLAGALGGVTGGGFSMSGPPAVIWGLLRRWRREEFRASLQAYFTVISLVQLTLFWREGLLLPSQLQLNLLGLPAMVLGVWTGNKLAPRIDQQLFQRLLRVFVGIAGLAQILRSL